MIQEKAILTLISDHIGLKLHLLTNEHIVFQDIQIPSAKVHDINLLKDLASEEYRRDKTILGDRGYIFKHVQTDLIIQYQIKLELRYKSNQKKHVPINPENGL